jgi:sucrose phosphorylase
VWYLDLFAGTNDYAAAKRGRTAGHKEINRTTLHLIDIENGLKRDIVKDQIELIRLRNKSPAFTGEMQVIDSEPHQLQLRWRHPDASATLRADLLTHRFTVSEDTGNGDQVVMSF